MKYQSCLFALLFLSSVICYCSKSEPCDPTTSYPSTPIKTFENGKLYQAEGYGCNHINVSVLAGNWQEMGRQHGALLSGLIKEYYNVIVKDSGMSYSYLKNESEQMYKDSPVNIQQFISGLAETSGLSLVQQKILYFIPGLIIESTHQGCSSISVWGDYTGGQPLVIGRNSDFGGMLLNYKKYVCVAVYNLSGSSNSMVDVNMLTNNMGQTSLNTSSIYIAGHNGKLADPAFAPENNKFMSMLFNSMFEYSTINELDINLLNPDNLPPLSSMIFVADTNESRVYEIPTYGNTKWRTGGGLVILTNHFLHPDWIGLPPVPSGEEGWYTFDRYNHLNTLAEKYKGSINAEYMKEIYDTTLSEGGATTDENESSLVTFCQVITVPADRIMWVKIRGFTEWEKVNLNLYFQ